MVRQTSSNARSVSNERSVFSLATSELQRTVPWAALCAEVAKLKIERAKGHVYALAKTGSDDSKLDPSFTTVPTTSTAVSADRVAKAWNSRR